MSFVLFIACHFWHQQTGLSRLQEQTSTRHTKFAHVICCIVTVCNVSAIAVLNNQELLLLLTPCDVVWTWHKAGSPCWCRVSWAVGHFEGTVVGRLLDSAPELHCIAPNVLLALLWASLVRSVGHPYDLPVSWDQCVSLKAKAIPLPASMLHSVKVHHLRHEAQL